MRKAIFFLLILTSINIYSQKCKTEKDPFTNEEITSFDFTYKTVYFELKNDTIRFDIKFQYYGERDYEFSEGAEISLKFKDGSKMNLQSIREAKPKIESVTSSSAQLYLDSAVDLIRPDQIIIQLIPLHSY